VSFDARVLSGVGVLTAVTEAGSFARAGETLGMTPSGVSRAVSRLEARVGVRLFNRTPRSVTLTEEGRRLQAQVLPLLAAIEEATTEVAGASKAVRGRLLVNIDPWFSRMVLTPRLHQFMDQYPQVSVEMTVSNHREEMMTGADVAVRFGPTDDSSLIASKILDTRVVTLAAPAYIKKHGAPATPTELTRHEALLFRDPQTGRPFPWKFSRKGKVTDVAVRGRFTTDDPSSSIAACVAGLGLFQSLEVGLDPWLRSRQLVEILPDWAEERFPLYAYYHSRLHPPAKIRAFLDFLKEIAAAPGSRKMAPASSL
jgi:DNA-binding transcriptional LysR family regulator